MRYYRGDSRQEIVHVRPRIVTGLIAFLFTATTLSAQTTVWKAERGPTKIEFTVKYMVISAVTGCFRDFDVTLVQSQADFEDSDVEVEIKTHSIDTDHADRDEHLRSAQFLDVEKYPAIRFESTSFVKTGKDTYIIMGNLTIRDVTKPVMLDVRCVSQVEDGRGNLKARFEATTSIDRNDFGASWNVPWGIGEWLIGNVVDISIRLKLRKTE